MSISGEYVMEVKLPLAAPNPAPPWEDFFSEGSLSEALAKAVTTILLRGTFYRSHFPAND
jgi:hypothetical protein